MGEFESFTRLKFNIQKQLSQWLTHIDSGFVLLKIACGTSHRKEEVNYDIE